MYIIKVLKRKDASSVVVAIALALIAYQMLPALTGDLAAYLSGLETDTVTQWRESVVFPLVNGLLQVILLEAIIRLVVHVRPLFVRKKR